MTHRTHNPGTGLSVILKAYVQKELWRFRTSFKGSKSIKCSRLLKQYNKLELYVPMLLGAFLCGVGLGGILFKLPFAVGIWLFGFGFATLCVGLIRNLQR